MTPFFFKKRGDNSIGPEPNGISLPWTRREYPH